jgi:hypothetical protein
MVTVISQSSLAAQLAPPLQVAIGPTPLSQPPSVLTNKAERKLAQVTYEVRGYQQYEVLPNSTCLLHDACSSSLWKQ